MRVGQWIYQKMAGFSRKQEHPWVNRQSGFTLLEGLAAVGVMGAVSFGVFSLANQSVQDTRGSLIAMHIKTVGDAANTYIRKNYAAIQAQATSTTPAVITVNTLITDGQLPTGYTTANANGQNVCVLVLKPSSTSLNALVISEGGTPVDDLGLGQIVATIGGSGGGVYSGDTSKITGAMNGWSLPVTGFNNSATKCDGTAGRVSFTGGHPAIALWFSDGNSVSATLYRDAVAGNPALNTMNTPIIMSPSTNQLEGSGCSTDGAISRTASGTVVSCTTDAAGTKTWQRSGSAFWKDAVSDFASLPTSDAVGTVRVTKDTGRAFAWNGSAWGALSIDQNGNLTVPGKANVGSDLAVNGNTWMGGWLNVNQDLSTNGILTVAKNGNIKGDFSVEKNATVYGTTNLEGNTYIKGDTRTQGGVFIGKSATGVGLGVDGTVNFASDLNVNGGTYLKSLYATDTTLGGYVDMYQSARIRGGLWNNGGISSDSNITSAANIQANGRLTTNEYLQINGSAVAGASCPSNGLVGRDSTGKLLSCQNYVWATALGGGGGGGGASGTGLKGVYLPLAGQTISCQAANNRGGFTPQTGIGVLGWAKVDSSGMVYTRITDFWGSDTGWVPGFTAGLISSTNPLTGEIIYAAQAWTNVNGVSVSVPAEYTTATCNAIWAW